MKKLLTGILILFLCQSLAFAGGIFVPSKLSEMTDDSTHRIVTDTEKSTWNAKMSALSFADVVSIILNAVPSTVFWVKGASTDGGTTPDATTQANIDTLLAAGVPSDNIRWLYIAGVSSSFIVADMTSVSGIDNIVLTQSGGVFDIQDITAASLIDAFAISSPTILTFEIADMTSASGVDDITLVLTHDVFTVADMTSASNIDGPLTLVQSHGVFTVADATSASGMDNITITQGGGGSTEVTIYSTTADGAVTNPVEGGSWAGVRDASAGVFGDVSSSVVPIAKAGYLVYWEDGENSGYETAVVRGFFYFDTSSIPDGATIESVVMYVSVYSYSGSPKVSAQLGTQADPLTLSDFVSFSGNSFGQTEAITSGGYKTITFNSDGIAAINKTGVTKICLREYDHDYLNSSPASNGNHEASIYMTENNGTGADPKLVITYH